MKKVASALAIVMGLNGCAWFHANALPAINDVITAVQDANQILEVIAAAAAIFFAAHPDKALEDKYEMAITKCHLALDTLVRTAQGSKDLDQGKIDLAFADFKVAYEQLYSLISVAGIVSTDGKLAAAPGQTPLAIPSPLALTMKVVVK